MPASGDQSGATLGQRVEHQGYRGTVRFSGELEGQTGVWIGVDWDDPSRGKHDGSHGGVCYFKASHPTSGSFIRPFKLNFGISCVDAIRNRYGKVEGSTAGVDKEVIEELRRDFNIPFIEMVGFEKVNAKQSQFENLKIIELSGEPIKCAGDPGQLSELCPLIEEINLSNTLLNSWKVVGDITTQFKRLVHLDVSSNKLAVPSEEEVHNAKNTFKSLHKIVLNSVGYTWDEVLTCANMWPGIATLSVRSNKICELKSPDFGVLSNLTSLYLQMNPINDWANINKLGNLVSLQILHLGKTGITKIFLPGEDKSSLFPSLIELNLQNNDIDDWISVNELNKLASLQTLNIQSTPLLEKERAWDFVIARVRGLKKLNCTEIIAGERRGCEYDYMKFYGREWLAAQSDPILSRDFQRQHPRYAELIASHGSFSEDDFAKERAPLKSRLMNIKIFCSDFPDRPEIQKKVPRNMTVQKLSGLVQKLISTGGSVPSLHSISSKVPGVSIPLDKDMQDLSYYSIEDGDSIAVSW